MLSINQMWKNTRLKRGRFLVRGAEKRVSVRGNVLVNKTVKITGASNYDDTY